MTYAVEFLIERLANRETKFYSENLLENHDIFKRRFDDGNYTKFKYAPRHMYFYYVRVNEDGTLRVTHHEHYEPDPNFPNHRTKKWKEIPRTKPELEALVGSLADKARNGSLKILGRNFQKIEWQRRSYIVLFIDEPNWRLYRNNDSGSAWVFLTEKGGLLHTENYSFFDAMDLEIQTPDGPCSAIAFINHLKGNREGDDLKPNAGHPHPQGFQFNVFLKLEFEPDTTSRLPQTTSPLDIIIDPGGTNQGPALLP